MSDGDWVSALYKAIMDKFATSVLFTDLSGRLFMGTYDLNPPVVYPYGIFFVVVETPDRTFTENYQDIIMQFSLFYPKTDGVTVLASTYNHLIDLYDEGTLTITGYRLEWMRLQSHSQMVESVDALPDGSTELNHWSADFEIRLCKN